MPSPYGSIKMTPHDNVVAGERVTLTFTYVVGTLGVKRGGCLRIRTPNDGWGPPLAHREQVPKGIEGRAFSMRDTSVCTNNRCNLSATLKRETEATVNLRAETGVGPFSQFIVAEVADGDLVEGDVITVVYGDPRWGEDGVEAQKVAPTYDQFVAHVDTAGDGEFQPLDGENLRLNVRPGPVTIFNMVAPSMVKPGCPFEIKLSGLDAFRNKPPTPFLIGTEAGTMS